MEENTKQTLSYSAMLKSKLVDLDKITKRHCLMAELYALVMISAKVSGKYNESFVSLYTENVFLAKRCTILLKELFGFGSEVSMRTSSKSQKRHYLIYITNRKAKRVVDELSNNTILKKTCCKQAYLKGAFLACASISDPSKNYHLEFVLSGEGIAKELLSALNAFDVGAGIVARKNHYVVYIKDGEKISQILGLIGAGKSLLDFENLRIFKTVSNDINRKVNCETANIAKTAKAFVSFQEDIEYIERTRGSASLPGNLIEVARLKLDNPGATLKELGELLKPPISKSGVNHRLRKISEIAEKLRSDLYD